MRIKSFVFSFLLMASSHGFTSESLSYENESVMAVIGLGNHTCKKYLASLNSDNKYLYRSWAAGYVTSFGHIVTKSNDFHIYYKNSTFYSDLKTYCTDNKTVRFFDAVNHLLTPIVIQWTNRNKQANKNLNR
ncbi:hypothetical protein [Neptuniibacter sp.]|uniref:hypothetical protein n=1 Tax=Neptuniibacter sp. TaxID=1962643 RepID=UPI00262EC3C5|nr:hypothetical protein [Neptuniibacter sp.]MCP4597396.1 hypothetical protein [Neptuniibacter sp.]